MTEKNDKTEKKIKIKELADELKIQHAELLTAVRKEGMSAKNAQTLLPPDMVDKMRRQFGKAPAEPDKKEVIVRRRRRPQREEGAAPSGEVRREEGASDRPRQERQPRPQGQQRQGQQRPQTQPARVVSRPGETARIIQPAQAAQVAPSAQAAPTAQIIQPAPQAEKPAQAKPVIIVKAAKPETPTEEPKVEAIAPKAPEATTAPAAEPIQTQQPEVTLQAEAPKAQESKPEPAKTEQAKTDQASPEQPTEQKAPRQDTGKARIVRPSASAQPEGSSAPGLTRPAREGAGRKPAEEGSSSGVRIISTPKQQGSGDAAPRVKIISRPSAPTAAGAPGRRDRDRDRDRDSARPGSRDGGSDRPRRDGSQHPRPARPGGGFRQPQSDAGGMDFGGGAPMDSRNDQSKKKRNKGRRTVDFQSSGFGHHQEERDSAPRMHAKGHRKNAKAQQQPITQPLKAAKRKLRIEAGIRVSDMAHQMGLKANEIIKVLFNLGIMATINQNIDFDTATLVASEFDYEVEKTGFEEKDYLEPSAPDAPESLKPRPPVVTIMGHVDHGKTSLLDAIRKSHLTSGEAGGITQHIGAYHVHTKNGDVVFLDTPGHEAFTAMRARGAQITDIVILVVAADDGVMEQTREAVNHSRAAGVPIMVAVNKIDKPGANPDRVLRELSELGLQPEDWGGDTIVTKVSAKTREGLDDLLELLALQSEVMDLKANPDKPARGHIVEAKLDKGRGPVATVLIQEGTLHMGDNFVCGTFSGRVRALLNDQGKKVREAGPSIPVEVQGCEGVPIAGEEFAVVADEKVARRIADARAVKQREKDLSSETKVTLETFLASSADEEQKSLNIVLKADVQGTLEAVAASLKKAGTDKVTVNVVHGGTGAITESDILLASASKAIIVGFNIRPAARIKDIAAHEGVDIRFYDIIYNLIDDVKSAMAGLLAPVEKEVYLGQAEVRQTFNLPKIGTIAGSYVADGKIARNAGVRLLRDGVVVYTGHIASLKRFKDDAKEVVRGNECGVGLENFNDIKVGDIIEAVTTVQEAATL